MIPNTFLLKKFPVDFDKNKSFQIKKKTKINPLLHQPFKGHCTSNCVYLCLVIIDALRSRNFDKDKDQRQRNVKYAQKCIFF